MQLEPRTAVLKGTASCLKKQHLYHSELCVGRRTDTSGMGSTLFSVREHRPEESALRATQTGLSPSCPYLRDSAGDSGIVTFL
jgi:hypothetical protein